MAGFHRVFSLSPAFIFFKPPAINSFNGCRGSTFRKLSLIQSRCLFTKKSLKDFDTKEETKKPHSLFQLSSLQKNKTENVLNKTDQLSLKNYNLSDVMEKIKCDSLNERTVKHYLSLMLKIYFHKRTSPDFSVEVDFFVKSDEFESLAQSLEQSLPMLSVRDLYLVFQVMHHYRIPCSSVLMQKLHALILDNINDFKFTEIVRMYINIREQNDQLLEPVKSAFLAHLNYLSQDEVEFMGDIRTLIFFSVREELPLMTREKMVKKILEVGPELKNLEPYLLMKISFLLSSPEFQHLDKSDLLLALKEASPYGFQFGHLNFMVDNISTGIRQKFINYDEHLLDTIAVGACQYEFGQANFIMKKLLSIGHVSYELAKVVEEGFLNSYLQCLKPLKIEEIICNFGAVDYKDYTNSKNPSNWIKVEAILKDYIESGVVFQSPLTYLSLFSLQLASKELINKGLNKFYELMEEAETVSPIFIKRVALLYQCFHSAYSNPPEGLPENFLADCLDKVKYWRLSEWEGSLYETFNGEEYVLKNCKSPYGTVFSYIVVLGPDGTPINLSAYKKPEMENCDSFHDLLDMKNIQLPAESKVLAFIESGREPIKFRNVPILRPLPRVVGNIHESLNYKVSYLFSNQKSKNIDFRIKVLNSLREQAENSFTFKKSPS